MFLGVVLRRVYAAAGSFGRAFGVTLPVAILTIASVQGCAGPKPDLQKKSSQMVWPSWPDQPRFAFQTVLGTEASIVPENPDQRLQRMLTGVTPEERKERIVIGKPSGIAVREGRVYVTDPAVKAVTVLDASRKRIYRFGLRAPNTLERPQSVALDANSWVYVLDTGLRHVMVFDALGLFKYSIAVKSGFTSPVAVAVNPDGKTVYVVDRGDLDNNDHKVVAFDPDGKEKFRIGPRGQEVGQFNIPLAATVSPDGTLLVADAGNARIQAFDSNGKFKFTFGGFGAELGRFSRPRSIATDSEGNIYVADAGFNNVQVFNAKGELLMPIGQLSQDPGPGNYSLIGVVAIDDDNRLYVTDNLFRKIDVFRRLSDEEGKKILATTDAGSK